MTDGAVPTPLPTPTPVPSPPSSAPDDARLLELLPAQSHVGSRDAALRRVAGLWGGAPLERTALRTHLDQIRRLDFPVVLELFHPGRRDTVFVALTGLSEHRAEVALGDEPPLQVSSAALDRLWTRDAVFVWRDANTLGRSRQPARTERFVREALGELGYPNEGRLSDLVGRFQREVELLPDGLVGDRTLMAIYAVTSAPRPRLRTGGKVS